MLRLAAGCFITAMIALAGTARADVKVIYPPQSYQAPLELIPYYWVGLYYCGYRSFGGCDPYDYSADDGPGGDTINDSFNTYTSHYLPDQSYQQSYYELTRPYPQRRRVHHHRRHLRLDRHMSRRR